MACDAVGSLTRVLFVVALDIIVRGEQGRGGGRGREDGRTIFESSTTSDTHAKFGKFGGGCNTWRWEVWRSAGAAGRPEGGGEPREEARHPCRGGEKLMRRRVVECAWKKVARGEGGREAAGRRARHARCIPPRVRQEIDIHARQRQPEGAVSLYQVGLTVQRSELRLYGFQSS